jgi:hypothetical protein
VMTKWPICDKSLANNALNCCSKKSCSKVTLGNVTEIARARTKGSIEVEGVLR